MRRARLIDRCGKQNDTGDQRVAGAAKTAGRRAVSGVLGRFARVARSPLAARRLVLESFGQGGVGAEIGVFEGDFSAEILRIARPKTLHLIDPWENQSDPNLDGAWYGSASETDMNRVYSGVETRFSNQIATGGVVLHRQTSADALAALPAGSLDFAYIDGDHRYEAVVSDLTLAYRALKPGGILACDDYRAGGWWGDGVIRAVHDFLGRQSGSVRIEFVLRGQVVLRKTD